MIDESKRLLQSYIGMTGVTQITLNQRPIKHHIKALLDEVERLRGENEKLSRDCAWLRQQSSMLNSMLCKDIKKH